MKKYNISYQGQPGAYSEQATIELCRKLNLDFNLFPQRNFNELFKSIEKEVDLGIVPIENSNAGSVLECYDLFLKYDFEIIAEYNLEVNHCMLIRKDQKEEDIKKAISHPQALSQCSIFLNKKNITPIAHYDTAGSAKTISESEDNSVCAIASEIAAKVYDLKIVEKNIQNSSDNITRFFLVKKKNRKYEFESNLPKSNKSSLIMETKDVPGALYKCLGAFATNNINLTKLESRPSRKKNFDYIFYVDFEGSKEERGVKLALEEINFFTYKTIFLGSYKAAKNVG